MNSFHNDEKFYMEVMNLIFDEYPDIIRFQCRIPRDHAWIEYNEYAEELYELHKRVGVEIFNGVSKCVLIGTGSEYVCKFPRTSVNDCQREFEIYRASRDENVEKYFAPCTAIGTIHRLPLYMMERMRLPSDDEFEPNYLTYSSDCDDYEEGSAWDYLCQAWGSPCNDLRIFMEKYQINDIHNENIGYDKNDILKLIDYSGFHGFEYTMRLPSMKSFLEI